ncbi:MAG: DegT/DnrJ/EryC1/StrS family aminotransferase [Brevinematia bacterium]
MNERRIPFSPPDITEREINAVIEVLKSGWITTGPKVREFEDEISKYCGTEKTVALNSATAGLELVLRLLDIGKGDEVITTPYTFAATSNVILHTGAKPVFVDINFKDFNISVEHIERAINKRTKAIISVDFGGFPCDYDEIKSVCEYKKKLYLPRQRSLQSYFDKVVLISDSAHSFGAVYKGKKVGGIADFTVFSFHAIKNITTAEGGAITFNSQGGLSADEIYRRLKLLSLHGQNRDAFSKFNERNGWYYEIQEIGYKYNMTDIAAAIGISQLERYESEMLPERKKISEIYSKYFVNENFILPIFKTDIKESSYHLYPLRIKGISEEKRNTIIQKMSDKKISLNVHFIPVVMHPAYVKLGYNIKDYPVCYEAYKSEISLPLYSTLKTQDASYVAEEFLKTLGELKLF